MPFPDDLLFSNKQDIACTAFMISAQRIIDHPAHKVHGRGTAAVQVIGVRAAQVFKYSGKLVQSDAPTVTRAAAINHDEDKMVFINDPNPCARV